MPDEPTLLRQWKLISLLSSRQRGLTIRELAREMNVVDKTIRRDLDLFREVGLPVEAATANGDRGCKRWRIAGTRGHPPLTFNFQGAAALYLAAKLLGPLAGTPLWESAQDALGRIRAMLGENAARYLEGFSGVFHGTRFGHGDYSGIGEFSITRAGTVGRRWPWT
jgi:predicted DNA-binding transcriptional regulator YafY